MRRTIAGLAAAAATGLVIGGIYYWGMRPRLYRPGEDLPEISRQLARDLPEDAPAVRFADVTADSGLHEWRSFEGPRSSQLPEDMGPGGAWGDYDNDGDDDLFLVSCGGSIDADPESWAPCALFENLGQGRFRRVDAFEDLRLVGTAAAWGDSDGDGWLDLVVTGHNRLVLFHNAEGTLVPDHRFPGPEGFWAGVAWGDYDNDRALDLYVCGYVRYEQEDAQRARASRQFGTVVPYTLNPSSYEPERNLLFHNNGDGTFSEVGEALGVSNPEGRSLGAVWHDFDQDGRLDLYVANDISDNVFYLNSDAGFVDASHAAWVADYRGAMGLAVGDWNRDGDDDIFVTHWVAQENALYDSLLADLGPGAGAGPGKAAEPGREAQAGSGGLRFVDVASMNGLGQIALQMVGWGAEFTDLDADGWLDLVVANGSTFETADEPRQLKPQAPFLFWNRHGTFFHNLAPYGEALAQPMVGRGLAVSDYDRDGDVDVLFVRHGEGALLLRNDMQVGNWVQIRLRSRGPDGTHTGFGDGATVIAHVGDVALRRAVFSTSYLSQSSRTVHLGLGPAEAVDRLEVRWLGGGVDTFQAIAAGTCWEIREGEPEARPAWSGTTEAAAGDDVRAGSMSEAERVTRFWSAQRAGMHALKVEGDPSNAIAQFRQALALDPAHEDARYYLASCLAETGDTAGAIREFEALLEIDPRSHRGLKRLGILVAAEPGSPEGLREGLDLLERARSVNPEETGVLTAMGEIDVMLGDYDMAEQRLEWVCRTNPRAVEALYLRAYVAWRRGDEGAARDLLGQARTARGEDWKPQGTTAEGDVGRRMHSEETLLASFCQRWDGSLEPVRAFKAMHEFVEARGERPPEP